MVPLKVPLALAKYTGLLISFYPKSFYYKFIPVLVMISSLFFVVPLATYYSHHLDSLKESTEVFSLFAATLIFLAQILLFVVRSEKFKKLNKALQKLVKVENVHLAEAEKQINIYTKWYGILMLFTYFVFALTPEFAKLLEYYQTGDILASKWKFPYKMELFYNVHSSPAYELTYSVIMICVLPITTAAIAYQLLFLGVCLYICALFRHLKDSVEKNCLEAEKCSNQQFIKNIKILVDYHNDIHELAKMLEEVYAEIYFAQYFLSIIVLCSQAYLTAENLGKENFVGNVMYYQSMSTMIFIYTYFGTVVTTESESVAQAIMGISWDKLQPKRRFYYRMMLHRSQKKLKISAYHIIDFNLLTFMTLTKASFSVYTLLQNIGRNFSEKGTVDI